MNKEDCIECEYSEVSYLFKGQLILLVTVTEVETDEARSKLTALDGFDGILKFFNDNYTYYIGKFGKYGVVLVQTGNMGSMSAGGSILTVKTALDTIKSKIVIMMGIAFGVDEKKQNIGDVLISETIIPYNLKRVGDKGNIPRGVEKQSSMLLLNRFKNITTWEHLIEDGSKAKCIIAKVLSGEELIDSIVRRNELLAIYPEARGGEMEGGGVAASCENIADWILVKGICDFADGQKGTDKKRRQKIAIESAVSLCLELFASETAFKEKGINPFCENSISKKDISLVNINEALFEVYDMQKESYYIERNEDVEFNRIISQYGIWIYGETGVGKTNLVLRNLIRSQTEYISITLGSCINGKNIDLFNELLNCVQEKTKSNSNYPNHKTFQTCCRSIQKEFESHYKNKSVIVYVDEIPINSNPEYEIFIKSLFALINNLHLINGLGGVKFVLSSIHNPVVHIAIKDQKIHQYMYFIQLTYWRQDVIGELINMILDYLHYDLPMSVQKKLIERANGSPRFIKKYFKNILLNKDNTIVILLQKIEDTDNELKQFSNE
jgi:nucleoside phosphorylase